MICFDLFLITDNNSNAVQVTGCIITSRLKASGLPVRFCTNETTTTRKHLVEKLARVGFDLKETEIFPPIPAVCRILQQRHLRPYLIVTEGY